MRTFHDMTIFNKVVINRETKYLKATVKGVLWTDTEAISRNKTDSVNADRSVVYVPFQAEFSKEYKDPKIFKLSPDINMTFQPGDIIVRGLIDDEIGDKAELERKYDAVRVITSVDKNDYGSPHMHHFMIGGS